MPVGGKRHLPGAIGTSHPGTLYFDPAPAEGHRAVLAAVTGRAALGIVLALGSYDIVDLGCHQLVDDAEADPDRKRQKALPGRPGEFAERCLNSIGQVGF